MGGFCFVSMSLRKEHIDESWDCLIEPVYRTNRKMYQSV